jgi:hypothetical protein
MRIPSLPLAIAILACAASALADETPAAQPPPIGGMAKPEPERKSFFESRRNTARVNGDRTRPVANPGTTPRDGSDAAKAAESGKKPTR